MTKSREIEELAQRVGREIAIELVRNDAHTVITEEEAEILAINEMEEL